MHRQNPFRISALNSLKIHEVEVKDEKQLKNVFKGANDLRNQLNKTAAQIKSGQATSHKKSNSKPSGQHSKQQFLKSENNFSKISNQTNKTYIKPETEALIQQVAALDNFKAPVTRQKTKKMIQNIKVRRRQKHIQAYNLFKEDLDDYKENLLSIYESIVNDCSQVLNIQQSQLSGYLNSQTDQYLLDREKQILQEIQSEYDSYIQKTNEKISSTKQELERIKVSRGTVVDETCELLRKELFEIAFVLEDEARQIEAKEKEEMTKLEQDFYEKHRQQISVIQQKIKETHQQMSKKQLTVQLRWKTLKHNKQIEEYQKDIKSQLFMNPKKRKALYDQLIELQKQNHEKKIKALSSLIQREHVDTLRKSNMDKWKEILKTINQEFDNSMNELVKQLLQEKTQCQNRNLQRRAHLQTRVKYIAFLTDQENEALLRQKFMMQKNISNSQKLMKDATSYAEQCDQKQNVALENLNKFILKIAVKNDEFAKQFAMLNQKYELQKAKALDDDQEHIQKLMAQFEISKQQLRESLHHIKLEEIQKKCFEKIDELEQAYRKTHQQNKDIASRRPVSLEKFMSGFEQKMAQIFQLYQESKRNQLIQKNKQEADQHALKIIESQNKKKAQEDLKIIQEAKKKGGKAPPAAKPKDPKKLAAEIQERKKVILAKIGQKKIQELKTGSGNTWLVFRSLEQICRQFYKADEEENTTQQEQNSKQKQQKKQNSEEQPQKQQQQQVPLQVDQLKQPIKDIEGRLVTTNISFLKVKDIANLLLQLRDKIFANISSKSERIHKQSDTSDAKMLEESLTILDQRLKQHYSLKGKLQSQIFVKRSGQITNHKKRYEKYARTVRDQMDSQTQRFNFLLQKGLQSLKKYNLDQKTIKQQLPNGKSLSDLQGYLSKTRQNSNKFSLQIKQTCIQLNRLCNSDVEVLLQKNKDFIKESKLLTQGGQYSQEEVNWYKQMMEDITKQITIQKEKRNQKLKQLEEQSEKRKKQLTERFQKEYNVVIEEFSAKDGTGKKYGKPKRMAQEKIRLQMNKCEKAQINIDKQISQILAVYQSQRAKDFCSSQRPNTLEWRAKLMTVQTCVQRYAKHVDALKPNLKIKSMARVNYDQSIPDCALPANAQEEDKKRLESQISQLGPLSEQKEDKSFSKYILDIEKLISDEARTIYSGDKAKYLTGNDKLPDFLRIYNANMKKSAEDFRMNCIRQLRESCNRLAGTAQQISQLFFAEMQFYFISEQTKNSKAFTSQFTQFQSKQDAERKENLRRLRPNLSNPKCQEQLSVLNEKQLCRQKEYVQRLSKLKESFKDQHFCIGQKGINALINNWEFLVTYYDSVYLFEDFISVTGDDAEEKKQLDIKKLMIMKQKGIKIDSTTERNIRKKWQGLNFVCIDFDDKKYSYKKPLVEQVPNPKDKKAVKKEAKKPIAAQQQVQINSTCSKQIDSFKTWRQKSVFVARQKCHQSFRKVYVHLKEEFYSKVQIALKQNTLFKEKWQKIASQLYLK